MSLPKSGDRMLRPSDDEVTWIESSTTLKPRCDMDGRTSHERR